VGVDEPPDFIDRAVMKTDFAVHQLRLAIVHGRYRPGDKLRQNQVAQELGLSPTPVREALRRLQAEGLVTHSPHRGVRVSSVALDEIREIYRILAVLEALAARALAERSDRSAGIQRLTLLQRSVQRRLGQVRRGAWVPTNTRFHDVIREESGMPHLRRVLESLWGSIPRDPIGVVEGMAESTTAEHQKILDALSRGDPDGAEEAMLEHMRLSSSVRLAFLEQRPVAAADVDGGPIEDQ
jgi:DNA-binding GntR family transcriptional regulator